MRKYLSLIILSVIISCNSQEVTEIETNAVQKVLNFYDGDVTDIKGLIIKMV